jgi:eukaryotic-like serine/threonine-protein kinase
MKPELWDSVSDRFNTWLLAGDTERQRMRAQLASEDPELAAALERLMTSTAEGFLETPALILAAEQVAQAEAALIGSGMTIGPYRIVSLLARGGMGDVYRATDERLHRDVALKVLADTRTGESRRVDRFMHEARVTASLDHPNVVRVFDVGLFENRAYLVAELLEGETLRSRINRGPMPSDEVLRIGKEIAQGLTAAHAAGLVHRDLKPDNIFLIRSGTTKILDFGIAKLVQDETVRGGFSTATGILLGTAGYIAPEQIRGLTVDRRADLFAFGVVLFEMLTGERAFAREHLIESLHAILHDPPSDALVQRDDVPLGLKEIVGRLLEKAPESRFQSAEELFEALSRVDPADVAGSRRALMFSKVPAAAGVIALVLALLAGGTAFMLSRQGPAQPAPAGAAATVAQQPLKLAIMPVRSIPPGDERNPLELGLAEVLISRLGQLSNVQVLPLSATERLRNEDPVEAARKLGADHVLSVTLQRDDNRVRAVPRLMSASSELIWGTTVDTDASSVFSIQDIIVSRVVDELAPRLSGGARNKVARIGTNNNDAWEAYVRGRSHVLNVTGADLSLAKEAFEEALRLDPNYADAWAGLGSTYKRMPITAGMSSAEALTKAKEAAERALQLEPDNAEAHSVLGTVAFWYERDYAKSERLLRRSLALQPSSADTEVFLAHLYACIGRHEEALVEIRRARALDPVWPVARMHEGHFLVLARRYDEALRHVDDAIKVDPRFWPSRSMKIMALVALERYDEVVQEADEVAAQLRGTGTHLPAWVFSGLKGYSLARAGRSAEADRLLDEIVRQQPPGHNLTAALILHGLGRDQEAFEALRRGIEERDHNVTFLGVHSWWDDVRDVPEFRELLREVNLLEVSDRVVRTARFESAKAQRKRGKS